MKYVYFSLFISAATLFSPSSAHPQIPGPPLTRLDQAHLDSLAAITANKVREAKLTDEKEVLVMDFFRNSPGESSQLGTLLADRFSESLASYSTGFHVLDREILRDYLVKNWTTLEDLRSREASLAVARQLGATGVILGTLTQNQGNIDLTLHLEGFGPTEKEEDDIFAWRDRTTSFPVTQELYAALYKPGPNYTRSADKIPEEPGVFISGISGVTQPECIYCPNPDYSDVARTAKFQGTVILSVVVTVEGQVKDIYVLKGAPFDLTAQAIKATKNWRFKPGQKDGKPVPVRVSVETTFRLI